MDQKTKDLYINKALKCGRNQGAHAYIPHSWKITKEKKQLTSMLCRVCFHVVYTAELLDMFPIINEPQRVGTFL